jgi:hypothetical protein
MEDLETRILDGLVAWAHLDKACAWRLAKDYEELGAGVQCTPKLFAGMQDKLKARMLKLRENHEQPTHREELPQGRREPRHRGYS